MLWVCTKLFHEMLVAAIEVFNSILETDYLSKWESVWLSSLVV